MSLRRRALLESAVIAAAASAVPGCSSRRTVATARGELVRDPKGVLDLPEGFGYRVLQRTGDAMSDGYRVPGRPDAIFFPCSSFTVLICCLEKIDDPVVLIKDAMITRSLVPAA